MKPKQEGIKGLSYGLRPAFLAFNLFGRVSFFLDFGLFWAKID
jgi:hypothetical protein